MVVWEQQVGSGALACRCCELGCVAAPRAMPSFQVRCTSPAGVGYDPWPVWPCTPRSIFVRSTCSLLACCSLPPPQVLALHKHRHLQYYAQ